MKKFTFYLGELIWNSFASRGNKHYTLGGGVLMFMYVFKFSLSFFANPCFKLRG